MSESKENKNSKGKKISPPSRSLFNRNLRFSLSAMQGESHASGGTGLKYHTFSTAQFSGHKDTLNYLNRTGLNRSTGTTQRWNTGTDRPLYRSRRGSIGGLVQNPDKSYSVWRLSSHATSRALAKNRPGSALKEYDKTKTELEGRTKNSRSRNTTVNSVISDFGKVVFNKHSRTFSFTQATHANGVSGSGLSRKVDKKQKEKTYEYSSSSMLSRGKKPTPSATYHSEPMALRGHDLTRAFMGLDSLANTPEMVGIMESNPNQICAQCAPMISQRVGTNSYVSGNPGLPFGGQKPGPISASSVVSSSGQPLGRAEVHRSIPSSQLDPKKNIKEVSAIHAYHGGINRYFSDNLFMRMRHRSHTASSSSSSGDSVLGKHPRDKSSKQSTAGQSTTKRTRK